MGTVFIHFVTFTGTLVNSVIWNQYDELSYQPLTIMGCGFRVTIRSVKRVLVDFLTPILANIGREPTREGIIELHILVSGNTASVFLNLGGVRQGHLVLTMTSKEYAAQTGFAFVPPHNPSNYPPTMGNAQEQALGTEKFRQIKRCFENTWPLTEILKIRSSRQRNQSSCPHWWTSYSLSTFIRLC